MTDVDPFPIMPPDLIHAIGMVTVQASRLEAMAAVVMWSSVPGDQLDVRRTPGTPDEFGKVVQRLHDVAKTLPPDVGDRLRNWLRESKNTMARRHRVTHANWGGVPDARGRYLCQSLQRLKGRAAEPQRSWMTVEDVERVANDIDVRLQELHGLLADLVQALPHKTDFILPSGTFSDLPEPVKPEFVTGRPGAGLRVQAEQGVNPGGQSSDSSGGKQ